MILSKRSELIRPDRSKEYLRKWYSQGFRAVKLKLIDVSCRVCRSLRDAEFYIWNLLRKDNPLFRITHPNCQCGLIPIQESNLKHDKFDADIGYLLQHKVREEEQVKKDIIPPVEAPPEPEEKPEETPEEEVSEEILEEAPDEEEDEVVEEEDEE